MHVAEQVILYLEIFINGAIQNIYRQFLLILTSDKLKINGKLKEILWEF